MRSQKRPGVSSFMSACVRRMSVVSSSLSVVSGSLSVGCQVPVRFLVPPLSLPCPSLVPSFPFFCPWDVRLTGHEGITPLCTYIHAASQGGAKNAARLSTRPHPYQTQIKIIPPSSIAQYLSPSPRASLILSIWRCEGGSSPLNAIF